MRIGLSDEADQRAGDLLAALDRLTAAIEANTLAIETSNGLVDVPALAAEMRTGSKRPTGGDEAKTRYWGLLEAMPDAKREDGSTRTGWWRLTGRGADFVRGDLLVPKHARIYDGRLLGLDDTAGVIGIRDALGSRFDYDELMDMSGAPGAGGRSEGAL